MRYKLFLLYFPVLHHHVLCGVKGQVGRRSNCLERDDCDHVKEKRTLVDVGAALVREQQEELFKGN